MLHYTLYSYYYAAMEREYLPTLDPSESVCYHTLDHNIDGITIGDDKTG